MNPRNPPEAFLKLSSSEQAVVWRTMPRFSPYRAVLWWQVAIGVLGVITASLCYACYRSSGGHGFMLPMAGFYLLAFGLWTILGRHFLYRPAARIGLERATADFLSRCGQAPGQDFQQDMPSPDRISST